MTPTCPLCQHAPATLRFHKENIPYYRCPKCGFEFATPASNPNLENQLADFEPSYLQYLEPEAGDDVNFGAQWQWMKRFGVTGSEDVLDVGCGSGKWVRYLRAQGVSAFGLEPSRALFDHFLAKEDWFSCHEVTADIPFTQRRYPVVTSFDVLEHVAEPTAFLARLAEVTEPGGWLFLSTPDVGSVPAKMLGRRWHFFCPYHLSYFSPKTLAAAAQRVGLEVVHVSHRGRYRSVGYAVRYLFEFFLRRRAPDFVSRMNDWHVPLNLCDTMYACLRKPGAR